MRKNDFNYMSNPESNFKGWSNLLVSKDISINEAVHRLNETATKILLVVNQHRKLIGTVSDGDIRRGFLRGYSFEDSLEKVMNCAPVTTCVSMNDSQVFDLMRNKKVQQIPKLDDNGLIIGLYLWDELDLRKCRNEFFVIMAGGFGKRLMPYTENCPKPLIRIGNKPILQHIIEKAKENGFHRFVITTHYLGEMIEAYFGSGEWLGVQIIYVKEESPLGTAGALGLINSILNNESFVVSNGDIISDINYGNLIDYHYQCASDATMAVRMHELQIPFGVVNTDGTNIISIEEKPNKFFYVNCGVYAFRSEALSCMEKDGILDMPDFFDILIKKQKKVNAYFMSEPWLDVGRHEDLQLARSYNI